MGHGITPAEVSGAQSGLNSLSQALQQIVANKFQAQQQVQQQQQLDLAQQREESEEQERKAQATRWQKEVQLREKELEGQRSLQDVNRQLLVQKATEGIMNGNPFPGDQVAPADPNPFGPSTSMIHTIPGLGPNGTPLTITLPTAEAHAQTLANLATIQNKPAEDAKIREANALQDSEFARQLKLAAQAHADRLLEEKQRDTYETNRQSTMIKAQQAMRASEDARALQTSVINSTGGLMGIPKQYQLGNGGITITTDADGQPQMVSKSPADFVTSVGNDLRDGNISVDQLKKLYPKQASMILKYADDRGIKPLSQAQLDSLKGLNDISKAGDTLKTLAQLRAQQGGTLSSLNPFDSSNTNYPMLHDSGKLFKEKEQEFGQSTARVAGVLGNIRRLNQADVKLTLDSLIPDQSAGSDPMNGIDKYNRFITGIQNDFNTVTSGLPQNQKAILLNKFGATSLPYLTKTMQQPGQNPGTPPNATPALPMQGAPPTMLQPFRLGGQINQ